jgi:beta-glucosidase
MDSAQIEAKVEELLAQLTLKEKVALLSGKDNWRTVAIERLGLPSITMTDGPHGVRATAEGGRIPGPATSFPTGVSMAASWNPNLIREVGEALAEETRAMGCDLLLGPCVNIVRHPLAGRNFESYAEDPYLAGRIGAAWVQGVQSRGVGTSLKHFAANNQEAERDRGSSEVDERTLREIYLPQFESIVKEATPWTVMCSYNRINGTYASENRHLLTEILKDEWGYDGAVVSDWGANHTIVESVQGGLDLEMPGPARYYGSLLVEAVKKWQIEPEAVNEAARRVVRLVLRARAHVAPGAVNTPEHQALARRLAAESIVLLKNERNVLPLRPEKIRSIAVIGPQAAVGAIGGGGSSFLESPYRVSPLEALKARVGDRVRLTYEPGCDNRVSLPYFGGDYLAPAPGEGDGPGLLGRYYDNQDLQGDPVMQRVDSHLDFWWFNYAPLEKTPPAYSVRWTGTLTPPASATYVLHAENTGTCRIYLDGALLLDNAAPLFTNGSPVRKESVRIPLEGGRSYPLQVEYIRQAEVAWPHMQLRFAPDMSAEADDQLARAVEAARQADVALVFVGYPQGYETEGSDRPNMRLTGRQDELVQAVAAANPNTVVVLNTGVPVEMDWAQSVAAVAEAFYPGLEGGNAVADVLLGTVNPSGKLTVTFPRRLADTPAFTNFPGGRQVLYGEGIFVGYRYYDQKDVEPLFPFGHGLSYTSFAYSDLAVPARAQVKPGEPISVAVTVTNTGSVAGSEVVQLYVADAESTLPRPPKELKGFAKVALEPGESRRITFELDERAFAFYDPVRQGWVVEPGQFVIQAGSSSRAIRATAAVAIEA